MVGFVFFFIAIYVLAVIFFLLNFLFRKTHKNKVILSYTVVIAARNEENKIIDCLNSLINQSVLPDRIIVVDDVSDDNTASLVKDFSKRNPLVNLLTTSNSFCGKRAALFVGTYFSDTEWILTLDADCVVDCNWATSVLSHVSSDIRLLSGPVLYNHGKDFFHRIMYSELHYLMSAGAAAACSGFPFQVSGANLCFCKNDFVGFYNSHLGSNYAFGDDVFFLQYICRKYSKKSVEFICEPDSLVKTDSPSGLRSFVLQRVRWLAKAGSYRQILPFVVGAFLVLANVSFVVAAILFFITNDFMFLWLFCSKVFADLLLPIFSAAKWKCKYAFFGQLIVSIFYPLYIFVVGIISFTKPKLRWKGRRV